MLALSLFLPPFSPWCLASLMPPLDRVQLEGPVVDLLVDLVHHELAVGDPEFAALLGGRWDALDLSAFRGRLALSKEQLTLFLDASVDDFDVLHSAMAIRNRATRLVLKDGSELSADLAHMTNVQFGGEATIELHHWAWNHHGDPLFWVGRLEGRVPPGGNLTVREQTQERVKMRHDGLRLQGWYTWFLIRISDEAACTVIVDPGGVPIERDRLMRDFLCMQFCFGSPLRLDRLTGIDIQRQPVAALGLASFARNAGKHRTPVPDDIGEGALWVSQLFRSMTTRIHEEGLEPLLIAIASYLDSETDHLDGAYLKGQVGLEAFAKRLLGSQPTELLVKDEAAWKKWIKELRPTIRAHLVSEESKARENLGMVYDKFIKAMYAPTGGIVRKAFGQVVLPKEVLDEIKLRNYPAHGFFMNAAHHHDFDRDVRRLEMVQTLIAGLVALHVGYDGPLKGYDIRDDGGRLQPSWWPAKRLEDVAAERFVAERVT